MHSAHTLLDPLQQLADHARTARSSKAVCMHRHCLAFYTERKAARLLAYSRAPASCRTLLLDGVLNIGGLYTPQPKAVRTPPMHLCSAERIHTVPVVPPCTGGSLLSRLAAPTILSTRPSPAGQATNATALETGIPSGDGGGGSGSVTDDNHEFLCRTEGLNYNQQLGTRMDER